MTETAKTAILFFSRTASEEVAVKTFCPKIGKKGNETISQYLISRSQAVLRKTNLPVFNSFSNEQSGQQFGERLANSMEAVYNKGYEKLIVIGSDCPYVTSEQIVSVSQQLEEKKLVLGPSTDGGVYLIGMNKTAYQRDKFIALPWLKNELQNAWRVYALRQTIEINWLERFADIDQASDFKKFLEGLPIYSELRKELLSIIYSYKSSEPSEEKSFFKKISLGAVALRAPPFN